MHRDPSPRSGRATRAAYSLPCGTDRVMTSADTVWRASLRAMTVADLVNTVAHDVPPAALVAGANWIQEALT